MCSGCAGDLSLSTDDGASWTLIDSGLTNPNFNALLAVGTDLFVGTSDGDIHSTDNSTSWTAANEGLRNKTVRALAVSGTNLFAGTKGDGVWRRSLSEMSK